MSKVLNFFKGSDTSFGIFYPIDYLVAVLPSTAVAQQAEAELAHVGFADEDVLSLSAEEFVRMYEEHKKNTGLWGKLMAQVSKVIETEAVYVEQDLEMARNGSGFIAVYCPEDERKRKAATALEQFKPQAMRHYEGVGIEVFGPHPGVNSTNDNSAGTPQPVPPRPAADRR